MAHYECSVCGDVLCSDSECEAIKRKQREEFGSALGGTVKELNPKKEVPKVDIIPKDTIKIQLFHTDARVPELGSEQAAGYDLYAVEDVEFDEDDIKAVPLGFGTVLPNDIHGRIESRSGMALKGFVVLTGVIDADYRGEWKVILANYHGEKRSVKAGDRIAQVVFRETIHRKFEEVEVLGQTVRGAGGFGSTGAR
jgi:dUTP pyrophosphatase